MVAVAVVICNWNKKDDVFKCIKSVKESDFHNYDIYVVDNASTDGSADSIAKHFANQLVLIRNEENLGGSGGFNTGIRAAMKRDYQYIYLLDNDVVLEEDAMRMLFRFMEDNPDAGAVGSQLYVMDRPNQLQEFGAVIDWENFYIKPYYKGYINDESIPEIFECDYVPACSVMVRADAIKKAGLMDESCFIYWDDIEWFYRIKLSGYRVVAYAGSNVYHKMGAANTANTFATYYFWRNRINFFARYCAEDQIDRFSGHILKELFTAIYLCKYKGQYSSIKTLVFAIEDALSHIRGRARTGRINEREILPDRLSRQIQGKKVIIFDCENIKTLRDIANRIISYGVCKHIVIAAEINSLSMLKTQFGNTDWTGEVGDIDRGNAIEVIDSRMANSQPYADYLPCRAVDYILEIINDADHRVGCYVDRYFNIACVDDDIKYLKGFAQLWSFVEQTMLPVLNVRVKELRETLITQTPMKCQNC